MYCCAVLVRKYSSFSVCYTRSAITTYTAGVFIRLYTIITIFTRWSCLCPRAREIISRDGRIPTTWSRAVVAPAAASSRRAYSCTASVRRCQRWQVCGRDGTGVGGWGCQRRMGRGGRCVPEQAGGLTSLGSHDLPYAVRYIRIGSRFGGFEFFFSSFSGVDNTTTDRVLLYT